MGAVLAAGALLGACASSGEGSCALPSPELRPAAAGASPLAAEDPLPLRRGSSVVVNVDFAVSCTDTRPGEEVTAEPGRRAAVTVEIASGTYVKRLATVDSDISGKVSAPVVIPTDAPTGKTVLRVSGALERELQLS
ncbi:hypothetical protein [Terrabacter sp. 2RAF25]|uniref:hypothetical protein n=1 Tax=Terrabacter sp. 2RAF25 TaxID=3232998 RepID=UPI003F97970A